MLGESNSLEVLSVKQIDVVIQKVLGNSQRRVLKTEFQPASDGIAGFLGDHMKGTLHVEANGSETTVHVFVKRVPANNKPKADFISENCFNKRERLVFTLAEEFEKMEAGPYIPQAYIYTDSLIVLPDLTIQGYVTRHYLATLDLPHVLITAATLARFHAAYANYETTKSCNGVPYNILNDYADIMIEPTFIESPWIHEAAKVTTNFLATFSSKYKDSDLDVVLNLFIEACNSLRDYEETVNVLLHKDLWMNNIMFKYENGVPINAVLVDFQCMRYGPPTFDLMIFLYLTTSRRFREKYEGEVVQHYFKIFYDSLSDATKKRIGLLGYDKQEFLNWCERSRMFGIMEAMTIMPFVLMDPKTAQKTYDDPDTFIKNVLGDRSGPVISYAREFTAYRQKQLEVSEEFVERYVLKQRTELQSEN